MLIRCRRGEALSPSSTSWRERSTLRSAEHAETRTMQTRTNRTYVWLMKWLKWARDSILVAMTLTVPVAMFVVLLPAVALLRLLERLGVLPPGAVSPMPVLALAVLVGMLGAAYFVGKPAKPAPINTAYSPEVPVALANARLREHDVPPIGSDVVHRTTLFGEQQLRVTGFVPAGEYGPDEAVLTDAHGIEQTIALPLASGETITLTAEVASDARSDGLKS